MGTIFFDSTAEHVVVRRFPINAKGFSPPQLSSGGPRSCYFCFMWVSRMCKRFRFFSQPLTRPTFWLLHPVVPLWVNVSLFLVGNRETELKPTICSSFLLFRIFLSFLFSWPSRDRVPLSTACWGYSLEVIVAGLALINYFDLREFLSLAEEGCFLHLKGMSCLKGSILSVWRDGICP